MKDGINMAVGSLQGLLELEWPCVGGCRAHAIDADNGQRARGWSE